MKNLKTIVNIIKMIIKYGAIVTAVLKGINVIADELDGIDLKDTE